ncbi:bifunctional 4-hydroxy-2-oxoglutarate aldolase/2-dehydro-3-deoxy-phosphogluconate aldolase [Absicoccus porci]|jgi:2-dehydro-3-deoxyphosphogluconate aldolase/(4S)-4-hydroxy-2-oxoglutarate aldolase|uniref:2-dehydro-3-deoxyphosphogluconate aldolase n=1 Tax=Absicoccus porci TaxID=2486576 RepID=A0A3N0HXF0_9FIRM|nr:bifunctional 4-hydroxy-2-oxoglutarate aldolase/2-dehydro-3-deoxy-phosphogluconate aldolase [Absicoccus porci]RNM29455.1 2-dehydro-3-deoxyphosphogluconate aldolase [Absicoccus porci]
MIRDEVIQAIEENKIIAITRGIYDEELRKLAKALVDGGIRCFEITFDQTDPNTAETITRNIKMLKKQFGDVLKLGVGTVLTTEQVHIAKEAGAEFIVSPNFNESVVKETLDAGLVSMPGAMTPSEICAADEAGADFIKLFPAGTLGIKYCKDIFAPLHHVKYIATVSVTEETFKQYLDLGFVGAGISSRLVDKKLREEGNYAELTRRAQRFVEIASKY